MTEARIGRLLPASLHQAISDELPDRLEYYEEWLRPKGLRDGSIGLAPLTAVLGFLRTDGDAYPVVARRAGQLAAQWSIASMPMGQQRVLGWLPRGLRVRAALRVGSRIVQDVSSVSRATARVSRDRATVELRESLFCQVREPQSRPLCDFYAALLAEALDRFGLTSQSRVESCRAMSGSACRIAIDLTAGGAVAAAPGAGSDS